MTKFQGNRVRNKKVIGVLRDGIQRIIYFDRVTLIPNLFFSDKSAVRQLIFHQFIIPFRAV